MKHEGSMRGKQKARHNPEGSGLTATNHTADRYRALGTLNTHPLQS